jgi:hypothetical protein
MRKVMLAPGVHHLLVVGAEDATGVVSSVPTGSRSVAKYFKFHYRTFHIRDRALTGDESRVPGTWG